MFDSIQGTRDSGRELIEGWEVVGKCIFLIRLGGRLTCLLPIIPVC